MKLKITTFASFREHIGESEFEIEIGEPATVADLKQAIGESYPELAPLISRTAVSVDLQYADDSTMLKPINEIALIPPVSGG